MCHGGPKGGRPKISRFFFFPLPLHVRSFCVSLGVFSLNFGGIWKHRGRQMCTFGLSGCRVNPPRLWGRQGLTRQPENSKRAHSRVPALEKTTKIQREDTQREKKKENGVGEGKKAKFWAVRRRVVRRRVGRVQTNNTQQHTTTPTTTQHNSKMDWPKMDWPKVDWPKSAITGRIWPDSIWAKQNLASCGS